MLEILKKSSKKQRIDQNNEEDIYFKLGKSHSVESFQSKFMIPRFLKYPCLKGQGYSCFSEAILEDFNLRGKLNSFEIPWYTRKVYSQFLSTLGL